jgi:hypothetical protein
MAHGLLARIKGNTAVTLDRVAADRGGAGYRRLDLPGYVLPLVAIGVVATLLGTT